MKEQNKDDLQRFNEGEPYDKQKVNRRTFLSFLTLGAGGIAAYFGWNRLYHEPLESEGATAGARKTLRGVLNANEQVFDKAVPGNHLAKTYPASAVVKTPKVNGDVGLDAKAIEDWKLQLVKAHGTTTAITIAEIKALPKTDLTFDFKCVEGWEQVQRWAGVKFADFAKHFNLQNELMNKHVGLKTPDGKYYVGVDTASMLHPQTILAYEMNGQPITPDHGAPLRLIIPVKYGIKNLKQIGTIFFSNERPADYWAERGYDYFAGL
ncbi:molybdopterin-dependent oxidoreductase [Mucilaginibacter sp. RS28]|uniref:Molybdopterin-dependent oxidoreductase n=1 Tax=Mucilaginibacter straminoryzae TaxID=2932774 RepID=A0A9X1X4R4_9SPHI|nr:molybdopterin-dependent oxidoreductase [Mucilaginibacter straminoryzae]MCJ8210893.1 molybdopterin-dependent oxidoreductase [Mucilaginibacter straminoryzae]